MARIVLTVNTLSTDDARFDAAANAWLERAQAVAKDRLAFQPGSRYVRVVKFDRETGACNGVFAFLDSVTGDVLKAASFNAPAKGARANIFEPEKGLGVTEYGAVYFQRGRRPSAKVERSEGSADGVSQATSVAPAADVLADPGLNVNGVNGVNVIAPDSASLGTPDDSAPVAVFELDSTDKTGSFDIFDSADVSRGRRVDDDGAPVVTPADEFLADHLQVVAVG